MAKLGDLVARVGADTRDFNKAMGQVSKQTSSMVGNIEKMGKQMTISMTAPIALIGGKGFQVFRDFEFQMAKVGAVSRASATDMKMLRDNALELGASTRFTSKEVAALQTEYAKLGFSAQEITNVTAATLALAQATDTDLARAAEVAGSTLRAFQMDTSETTKLTDVMALSFSSTALDMESFAEAMKYVAPVAKAAGMSVEETTAMLGTLANAGVKGSNAGTSLRRIITDMGTESGTTSEKIAALGAKGLTLTDAFDEVGRTAQTALLVLANGAQSTDTLTTSLNNSAGAAKEMQSAMDATAEGSMKKMESAVEGLLLQLGESLAPSIIAVAGVVTNMAQQFSKLDAGTREIIVSFAAAAAAVGPVILVGTKMIAMFKMAAAAVGPIIAVGTKMIAMFKKAATAVGYLSKVLAANPYVLAAAAIGLLAYKMSEYFSFTDPAAAAAENFNSALTTANAEAAKGAVQVDLLSAAVQDETLSEEQRLAALEDLKKISPEYFGNLDMERVKMGDLTTSVNAYKDSLLNAAKVKVFTQQLEEQVAKMEELKGELTAAPSYFDQIIGSFASGGNAAQAFMLKNQRLGGEMEATQQTIDMLTSSIQDLSTVQAVAATSEPFVNYQESAVQAKTAVEGLEASMRRVGDMQAAPTLAPSEIQSTSPQAQLQTAPVVIPEEASTSIDEYNTKLQESIALGDQFGNTIGTAFGNVIAGTATAGEAMRAVGKEILKTLIGIAKANAIAAFSSPANPVNAATGGLAMPAVIAGGLALVEGLLGAVAFADGGIVSGPTLGLVGEYSGARSNPEVIAPLDKLESMIGGQGAQMVTVVGKISGTDIALSNERGAKRLNRRR